MTFDIYRINRCGRMEKYYLIELRGATVQAIHQESKMNDMDYEYISINYDHILCRHLIACTEFDYLLTPDNYDRLFPVVQKSILPAEQPVRKVTLVLGIFFDGTGNNAVNTRNMLEALTAQHFDIESPDAQSILARNAQEKMGISGVGATSYLGYYTNIHWLNELYQWQFPADSSYVQNRLYVEGIGTRAGTSPLTAWPPPGQSWRFPACTPISAAAICRNYAKTSFSPVRRWKPSRRASPGRSLTYTRRRWRNCVCSNIHRLSCPLYAPMRSSRRSGRTRGCLLTVTASHRNAPLPP